MTTENFDLKVDDVIVGNNGLGDRIGYYIKTTTGKSGIWVEYGSSKQGAFTKAVYVRSINDIRLATPEEIAEFEG